MKVYVEATCAEPVEQGPRKKMKVYAVLIGVSPLLALLTGAAVAFLK